MATRQRAEIEVDDEGDGDKPVASVQRALSLLDAFLQGPPTLSLAELAARTGLYKSTIVRLLGTLEQQGYIVRTENGGFHIGAKPLRLAGMFQNAVQPEDVVLPVLRDLVEKTRESASYMIRQGEYRITLYRVDSPMTIRDHGSRGDMVRLGKGATSNVFEAFERNTPKFREIRQRMVGTTTGSITPGMTGIAAPVFGPSKSLCVGVIVLTGPEHRFGTAVTKGLERQVREAARTLTERLGGDVALFDDVRR